MRNNGFWCVIRETRTLRWSAEYKMKLWVLGLREYVTPCRETMEEADEDFENLGFEYDKEATVQSDDHFDGTIWTRHIVQHCYTNH